jgi:prefoldin subunit 5
VFPIGRGCGVSEDEAFEAKVAELARQHARSAKEAFERKAAESRRLRERVEAVMRQLPVLEASENRIRALASEVGFAARGDYAVSRGDKAAIRALDTLIKELEKVRETLNTLPLEAENALEKTGGYSFAEGMTLENFARVNAAKEALEAKPVEKRAGRPELRLPAEVAREALHAYEVLTGKWAGVTTDAYKEGYPRSGEFLVFLTEIFEVLEITASPVSQAKKVAADKSAHRKFINDTITEAITKAFKDYEPPPPLKTNVRSKQKSPRRKG